MHIDVLYRLLCSDIHAFSPSVGRILPDNPRGKFPGISDLGHPATGQKVACLAIAKSLGKKCTDDVSEQAADVCLLSFLEANASCASWEPPVQSPRNPRISNSGLLRDNPGYLGVDSLRLSDTLDTVKMCLNDTFSGPTPLSLLHHFPDFDGENPFSLENIMMCGGVGPGVAIGASGTAWFDKFYQSPLTATSQELIEGYRESLPLNTVRRAAEIQRLSEFSDMVVQGGIYGSVPKNFETERSIEKQPSVNMWAQKGLATIMLAYLKDKYGFDLAYQPAINAELARRGSIDGSVATGDLKEASNRIPLKFIQWCLKDTSLLSALEETRTSKICMPWGEWLNLHLFASMGNGCTFVLQTAVFLAVVEAAYTRLGWNMTSQRPRIKTVDFNSISRHLAREMAFDETRMSLLDTNQAFTPFGVWLKTQPLPDWGVFGDDIICHSKAWSEVCYILGKINAQLNLEKSYWNGSFRESCGSDWYDGFPVRGVYAKTLKTHQGRLILLNRLIEWSAVTKVRLPKTCAELWKSIKDDITVVPLHESHGAGLRVPETLSRENPQSNHIRQLAKDYQTKVKTYLAYVPVVKRRTFSGAELSIYGPGILLSVIRGEVSSIQGRARAGQRTENQGGWGNPVFGLIKPGSDLVEAKWCWTTCWDSTWTPVYNASEMELALLGNLGLFPE